MSKQVSLMGLFGLAWLAIPAGLEAVTRPEFGLLSAGLRVPVAALWLVGPMVLAVAGAVTVGYRRAATETRARVSDD